MHYIAEIALRILCFESIGDHGQASLPHYCIVSVAQSISRHRILSIS